MMFQSVAPAPSCAATPQRRGAPAEPAESPVDFAANLRRLMARGGLTVAAVVERSGLDRRTVQAILAGRNPRPHARTLHRLAAGLGVEADELFQNPALLAERTFDRATNPAVDEVVAAHPDWFAGWTPAEFADLYSRFGTGGALTPAGASQVVQSINRSRRIHEQVALLLETSEADLLAELVEVLYARIRVAPLSPNAANNAVQPACR